MQHVLDIHCAVFMLLWFQAMAEDKSDEWFAKHNRQKAAAWDELASLEDCATSISHQFIWWWVAAQDTCSINLTVMTTQLSLGWQREISLSLKSRLEAQSHRQHFVKGPLVQFVGHFSNKHCFLSTQRRRGQKINLMQLICKELWAPTCWPCPSSPSVHCVCHC